VQDFGYLSAPRGIRAEITVTDRRAPAGPPASNLRLGALFARTVTTAPDAWPSTP
jgi:hypothetical protein